MKVYRFTKTGQYHQMLGKENQDYICSLENGKILAIMLADGATGCRKGMEGAKLACEAVSRVIETEGNTFFKYPEKKAAYLLTEQILYWIEQHKGKEDLTEYGSTFLLVLMEKKTGESVLVNLGDGAAISEKDHRLQYLMEPRRINGDTCLTTTKGAEQVMEIETKRIALGECVILGSDGFLEMTTDEQIYEALKERNLEQLNQHISVNEQSIRFMDKKMEEYKETEMNYTLLKDLSDTANGEQKGKTKISFERFVQSVYFDLILAAANERLSVMSEQRYYLLRKEENDINKGSSGLELEILDEWTGKRRNVRSLSGGESFKAALSLALGLSDVIQNKKGGIQVDTIFIDEGFGTLDADSLNKAMQIINSLSLEGNKLVGIISHVDELKDQIDQKIEVYKDHAGSKVK